MKQTQTCRNYAFAHTSLLTSAVFAGAMLVPHSAPAAGSCEAASLVSAGLTGIGTHACLTTLDGGVQCWGYGYYGELGAGSYTGSDTPLAVVNLSSGVASVTAGGEHTCALTVGGGVECWGDNTTGQLGNGSTTRTDAPTSVVGLASGTTAVAAGQYHSCATTTAGTVLCWGYNDSGQLGNGTLTNATTPVAVSLGVFGSAISVTAGGAFSCALTNGGGVICWGDNSYGELGSGSSISRSLTPLAVAGLASVVQISAGYTHACAVTSAGGVVCWGDNAEGQLGNGTQTNSNVAVAVSGLSSGVVAVAAGAYHTCAVTNAGGAVCWGDNGTGDLGNGNMTRSLIPVPVSGLSAGVKSVSAGENYSCAVTNTGAVWCWGSNGNGNLGDGSGVNSSLPVAVTGFGGSGSGCAASGATDGPFPVWALGALGIGMFGIARRRLNRF